MTTESAETASTRNTHAADCLDTIIGVLTYMWETTEAGELADGVKCALEWAEEQPEAERLHQVEGCR